MRDDQRGRARLDCPQSLEQLGFTIAVQRGGCLIEDQQRRRAQQAPGEDQALPFASGELTPAITDRFVEAATECAHAIHKAGQLERAPKRCIIQGSARPRANCRGCCR